MAVSLARYFGTSGERYNSALSLRSGYPGHEFVVK